MQKNVAGILGGMGPRATIDFISKVLEKTRAKTEQDHLRLLVDQNPRVPNRHAAISGGGEEVGSQLAAMARGLERAGADFLVMPCNTAHAFKKYIQEAVKIPFISIIDEVVFELQNQYPGKTKVGVMAAEGCMQAQLYQGALAAAGYQAVVWEAAQLEQFMALVYRIKAGDSGAAVGQSTAALAHQLVQNGAEILLAGCTEIPLVLTAPALSVPLIDSTDVLVASVIDYSLGDKTLAGS